MWNTLKGSAATDSCPGSMAAWNIYTRSTIIIVLLGPIVQAIQDNICHVWICRWLMADLSGSCLFVTLLWNCLSTVIEPFFIKYFDTKISTPVCCADLHIARCLRDCVLLTCPQTVITSFTFTNNRSLMTRVSEHCMFFECDVKRIMSCRFCIFHQHVSYFLKDISK